MIIPVSGDQASYKQRKAVLAYLQEAGYEPVDLGCYDLDVSSYDFYLDKLCRFMMQHGCQRGIVMCGSGLGISMGVNKYPGFRCGRCDSVVQARLARQQNDMNVLAMGGRICGDEACVQITRAFLETPFDPAYQQGVDAIRQLDAALYKDEYLNLLQEG